MNVELTQEPALRVAGIHHVGPYDRIPEAFARLGEIAGRAGLIGEGTLMLAVYHDDPRTTPAAALRSDAVVTIPPTGAIPAGLTELAIPGGRYARTTHVGPYDCLPDVWRRLMGEWLPRSGHRAGDGPSYEVYRNTPMTAAPSELETDLYVPLG